MPCSILAVCTPNTMAMYVLYNNQQRGCGPKCAIQNPPAKPPLGGLRGLRTPLGFTAIHLYAPWILPFLIITLNQ